MNGIPVIKMTVKEVILENKTALAFTLVVMILGTLAYFVSGGNADSQMMAAKSDAAIYEGASYKVAFAPDGSIKFFAHTRNNVLAKLAAVEGSSLPEGDAMVLGYSEALMMRREGLFRNAGDSLTNFFGIPNMTIAGVLSKRGGPADDMHFLDASGFDAINGTLGVAYVKVTPSGVPKLFYRLGVNEPLPPRALLAQGNASSYLVHELGGVTYYPLLVGANEARMMRQEGLFENPGDSIKGFFGKNVIIAGVLEETNSSLDMLHLIPLGEREWSAG